MVWVQRVLAVCKHIKKRDRNQRKDTVDQQAHVMAPTWGFTRPIQMAVTAPQSEDHPPIPTV